MADITISYKGNTIAEMNESGTKTLKTSGQYCEDDISIGYVKSDEGGTYGENEIIFYDYDGTIIYSCTIEQAHNLTELPTPPEHEGLIFQEWNYTREEINSTNHILDIGAIYDTYEPRTDIIDGVETNYIAHPVRLYIDLPEDGINIETKFGVTYSVNSGSDGNKSNKAMIDWGDGSPVSVTSEENVDYYGNFITNHTYNSAGSYVIKIFAHPENLQLVDGEYTPKYSLFDVPNTNSLLFNRGADWLYCKRVELGSICGGFNNTSHGSSLGYNVEFATLSNKTILGTTWYDLEFLRGVAHINLPRGTSKITRGGFQNLKLKSISLPNTITIIEYGGLDGAKFQRLVVPDSVTTLEANWKSSLSNNYRTLYLSNQLSSYPAYNCYGDILDNLHMGSNVCSLGDSCFRNSGLKRHVFEGDVTSFLSQTFYNCKYLKEVIFKGEVASIDVNCFRDCPSLVKIDLSNVKSVPNLSATSALSNVSGLCKIIVPQNLLEEFKASTNWSACADMIIGGAC